MNTYIGFDDNEPTCADLTDEDIYNIVRQTPVDEEDEDVEENILGLEEKKKITIKEVLSSYETIFNFVEESPFFDNELLDNLLLLKSQLDNIVDLSKRQSNLDSFLIKN